MLPLGVSSMAPVSGATSAEANYPNSTELFPPFGQIIIPLSRVRLSGFPPDVTCAVFGFLFNQFDLTQSVIVMFTDFNAFSMIVLNKILARGKYDWKLLLYSFGLPGVTGILGMIAGYFGPTSMGCYIGTRKPAGGIITNVVSGIVILVFISNAICYLSIWLKIRQIGHRNKNSRKTWRLHSMFVGESRAASSAGLISVKDASSTRTKFHCDAYIDTIDMLNSNSHVLNDPSKKLIWHKSCYSSFTSKSHLERLKKRYENLPASSTSEQEQQAVPGLSRTVIPPVDYKLCIFCQADTGSSDDIRRVMTKSTSSKILKHKDSDYFLSCRLAGVSCLIAAEV
ncbi:hypothetical protein LSH36_130g05004, partial [Paralvinella palmiformis]